MTETVCDYALTLSDYVARRYQDYWAVRDHKDGRVRAHYRANYDKALAELRDHMRSCPECEVEEVA